MKRSIPVHLGLALIIGTVCLQFPEQTLAATAAQEPAVDVVFEDFIGSRVCGNCHEQQYADWRESTHGMAGDFPSADTVVSQFDGTRLEFANATVTLETDAEQRYYYHVDQPGQARQSFAVAGMVGGAHMMGGGTQTSFAQYTDGSWRLLPFDYSRHSDLWFCDTTGGRGWLPITADLALEDCKYWPPVNNFAPNCGNCHSSQMQSQFDAQTRSEQIRFSNLAINCESCHGPGRQHVKLVASDRAGEQPDIAMEPLELLSKEASVQLCFRCHALTQKLASGYLPGKRFEEYYALNYFPGGRRLADGRVQDFGYQEGHLYSDCYLSGSMTCVDCHDPHSQGYRDIDDFPLPGKLDDGQCLDCHPAKADNVTAHTGHPADSSGSRCVACHMPFLQHGAVGEAVQFARSDHTIPIPRPALDATLGVESACTACHADQGPAWQQARVEAWHGQSKPQKPVIQALQQLSASGDPALARQLLMRDFEAHPAARFDLLRLASAVAGRETLTADPRLAARLRTLTLADDPDIAALASALLIASGSKPLAIPVAANLASRRRIGLWLDLWGNSQLNNGNLASAINLLEKARDYHTTLIPVYFSLASAHSLAGQPQAALNTLRAASSAGLESRDQYLHLLSEICVVFDLLESDGMQRSDAITNLCAQDKRQPAIPLGNGDPLPSR